MNGANRARLCLSAGLAGRVVPCGTVLTTIIENSVKNGSPRVSGICVCSLEADSNSVGSELARLRSLWRSHFFEVSIRVIGRSTKTSQGGGSWCGIVGPLRAGTGCCSRR